MGEGWCLSPSHPPPNPHFSLEAGAAPGPPHWLLDLFAHLPKNTDPVGHGNGPSAKIMFEKGMDHLDDKWPARHGQRVQAGETINSRREAAASVTAEPVAGPSLLCLLLLNVVLFTHN